MKIIRNVSIRLSSPTRPATFKRSSRSNIEPRGDVILDVMTMPPGGMPNPPQQPTDFQRAVTAIVASLRPGDVATYAEVAAEAGHPGSAQAVANVLRRFPDLPWWRVIPSSGRLYRTHRPTQEPLLRREGVSIDETGKVALDCGQPSR